MPFPISCPECNDRQTVPDEAAGKRLRCKRCGTVFRASGPDVEVDEDELPARRRTGRSDDDRRSGPLDDDRPPGPAKKPVPARAARARDVEDEDDEDEEDVRPARRDKKTKKKSPLAFILGVCSALLLVAGAVAAVAWSQGVFDAAAGAANADKPVERTPPPPEDYSEHVRIKYTGLSDVGQGRLWPQFEYEIQGAQNVRSVYYIVYRQPRGQFEQLLNSRNALKGSFQLPYVRDPEMTVWIAKKRVQGGADEYIRVSNEIRFPDVLGK
jgi:hypothetical protein